jgi:acetyltransferase-like isoleucine patch superfamily enzyme
MNEIIWGLNEQSKQLLNNSNHKVKYIFDKFTTENKYLEFEINKHIDIFKDKNITKCIIASTSYYFEIKKEIESINNNIEIIYIGNYLDNYPKTIMISSVEELKKCDYVKYSISGEIVIKNGLVIQLLHDIPISINVDKGASLYFDNNVLMDGVEISARETSTIAFGNKSYINKFGVIRAKKSINIGDNCAIAWNVCIMDNDGYAIDGALLSNASVTIGSNVWIGNNVNILKNTSIDDGCIVASMSKVKGNFEKNCLIAGIPARKEKENVSWKA